MALFCFRTTTSIDFISLLFMIATSGAILLTIINVAWFFTYYYYPSSSSTMPYEPVSLLYSERTCLFDCNQTQQQEDSESKSWLDDIPNPRTVWYFHHIPKCAGTAVETAMRQTRKFATNVMRDDNILNPRIKSTTKVKGGSVIVGHWPAGVFRRYPQLLRNPRYHKLFSIIRDPWSTRVSLYWYHRRWNFIPSDTDIVKYMLSDPVTMNRIHQYGDKRPHHYWYAQTPKVVNYLPYYFKCHNQSNCQRVLDHYSYVGVLNIPEAPNPLLPLAVLKNGDKKTAPKLQLWYSINKRDKGLSSRGLNYSKEMKRLNTPENRAVFQELNQLDYWLYYKCLERYMADWKRLVGEKAMH